MMETETFREVYFNSGIFEVANADSGILQRYAVSMDLHTLASEHFLVRDAQLNDIERVLQRTAYTLSYALREYIQANPKKISQNAGIIGIPRSGWLIAKTMSDELGIEMILSNQGKTANPDFPVLTTEQIIDLPETVIIADDVVCSGAQVRAVKNVLEGRNILLASAVLDVEAARELQVPCIAAHVPRNGLRRAMFYSFD